VATKIGIAGNIGYIAKNLKNNFKNHENISLVRLEAPNFVGIEKCDFVLDVSGPNSQLKIKNVDKSQVKELTLGKQKRLLEALAPVNIPYYRIASIYELIPEHRESLYSIIGKALNDQLKAHQPDLAGGLVYCTNLYGGIDSHSIVDLIRSHKLDNSLTSIENPSASRDFLHIETFLNFILTELLKPRPERRFQEYLVATGIQFSVGELFDDFNSKKEMRNGTSIDWETTLQLKENGINFCPLRSELTGYMSKK